MQQIIRTGIASFGMSGQVFHGPLLAADPRFQVIAIVERTSAKSAGLFPASDIVRSFDELLSNSSIELVVINTPNVLHFEQGKQALLARKHVVLEKPATLNADELKQLNNLAQKSGKMLTIFQNRRWDSDFLTIKQIVENGWLGKLVEYEAHFDRFRNYIEAATWKEEDGPGSGILYNLGTHMIDQVLLLFGKPDSVWADLRILRPNGKVHDSYDLFLGYADKKVSLKASYLVRLPGPKYSLHGTIGSFIKHGSDPQEAVLKSGLKPGIKNWGEEPEENFGQLVTLINDLDISAKIKSLPGNYPAFYDQVYRHLRMGEAPPVKPEEALLLMEVVDACLQSHAEKRVFFL